MSLTINPIRKMKLKRSLLQGNSIRQAMKDADYSDSTAHSKANATTNRCVKVCMDEIITEAGKRGIIDKAWNVVLRDLADPLKQSDVALPLALKDMASKVDATVIKSFNPADITPEVLENMRRIIDFKLKQAQEVKKLEGATDNGVST